MRLVQIDNGSEPEGALVADPHLLCITGVDSLYELESKSGENQ